MAQNVFQVPEELYRDGLPMGYDCTLFVGKTVGRLGTTEGLLQGRPIAEFCFEMCNTADPTEWVLRYHVWDQAADQLARWDNAGDVVGLVIAKKRKRKRIDLVLAINFTRDKWFSTDSYRHRRDYGLWNWMSFTWFKVFMNILSGAAVLTCGVGFIPFFYFGWRYYKQFKTVHACAYRRETAQRIEDWISSNRNWFLQHAHSSDDPSL